MPQFLCMIVGSKFHKNALNAVEVLKEGEPVRLVPDPENEYDSNAVRVHNGDDLMLGHVPAELSPLVADLIGRDAVDSSTITYAKNGRRVKIDYSLENL